VRLGYRKELEATQEGPERDALFQQLLARQYENGQALQMAATLEIDAVIDPAQTRQWLANGLQSAQAQRPAGGLMVDTW
jgi:acetyl-CoA carboxylase carboxyltransferase component